jgi:hypothetical protein
MTFSAFKRFSAQRESEETARAFARCFRTSDGKMVLEHLHNHVLFRVTDPTTSPDQLRFLEGQRQLVLYLCQLSNKSD